MMTRNSLGRIVTTLAAVIAVGGAGSLAVTPAVAATDVGSPAGKVTKNGGGRSSTADPGDMTVAPVISAGSDHTCATDGRGKVFCWGSNLTGQLGRAVGMKKRTNVPVAVVALGTDNTLVSAGADFSCALKRSGAVFCWGDNRLGQVGDGTKARRSTPVPVPGLGSRVVDVNAGLHHSCAVKRDGSVWCWGHNWKGAVGDGTTETRLRPVRVKGLTSRAVRVSAGVSHTCALLRNATVSCWGDNGVGQLGHDSFGVMKKPTVVKGMRNVTSVSAGWAFTCALQKSGRGWCWGVNQEGQLGDGSTTYSSAPRPLKIPADYQLDVLGELYFSACAGMKRGRIKCWGLNEHGQLGDGTDIDRSTPRNVALLKGHYRSLANGWGHSCAINDAGQAYCWGLNQYGQLGDGTEQSGYYPVPVLLPDGAA